MPKVMASAPHWSWRSLEPMCAALPPCSWSWTKYWFTPTNAAERSRTWSLRYPLFGAIESRHRTLSYASAGHVPGLVFLDSGEVKCTLDSTGPPLGLFPGSKFSLQEPISLNPGEIAVFLTDGSPSPPGPMATNLAPSACLIRFAISATIRR